MILFFSSQQILKTRRERIFIYIPGRICSIPTGFFGLHLLFFLVENGFTGVALRYWFPNIDVLRITWEVCEKMISGAIRKSDSGRLVWYPRRYFFVVLMEWSMD